MLFCHSFDLYQKNTAFAVWILHLAIFYFIFVFEKNVPLCIVIINTLIQCCHILFKANPADQTRRDNGA